MRIITQGDGTLPTYNGKDSRVLIPCMAWYLSDDCTADGVSLGGDISTLKGYASRVLIDPSFVVVIFDHPLLDEYMHYLWGCGIGAKMVVAVSPNYDSIFDAIIADKDACTFLQNFDGMVSAFVSSPLTKQKLRQIGVCQKKWAVLDSRLMRFDDKLAIRQQLPAFFDTYYVTRGRHELIQKCFNLFHNPRFYKERATSLIVRRPDLDGGTGAIVVTKGSLASDEFKQFVKTYVESGLPILIEHIVCVDHEVSYHINPTTLEWFVTRQIIESGHHRGNIIPSDFGQPVGWNLDVMPGAIKVIDLVKSMRKMYTFTKDMWISFDGAIQTHQDNRLVIFEANMRCTATTPVRGAAVTLKRTVSTYMLQLPQELSFDEVQRRLKYFLYSSQGNRGIIIGAPYCLPHKFMIVAVGNSQQESTRYLAMALQEFGVTCEQL